MKVADLIEELEGMDPEAEVMIVVQPSYPFECTIDRVVTRYDANCELDEEDEYGHNTDVLILQGDQVRYGSRKMFE